MVELAIGAFLLIFVLGVAWAMAVRTPEMRVIAPGEDRPDYPDEK